MKKKIILLTLLLAAAVLTGCTGQQQAAAPELMEPVGVQSDMAAAYIGEIYDIDQYDASVKPYVQELYFEVDGKVQTVNAYPGVMVQEGDILVELDQTSLEEQAESLKNELEYVLKDNAYSDALAELDIEILQVELRQLMAEGASEKEIALKQNEIEQKKAALRQAQALREPDIAKTQENLEEISESLNKNILRAPFSGRIVYGDVLRKGSWVSAYDPIGYISDDSQLSIISEYITESKLLAADRIYAHIGSRQYEIEMVPIDQSEYISMLLSGVTITTEFRIIGPEEYLDEVEAGQYAAICIYTNYVEDALLVPSGAVLRDASGRYVYVDEDGTRVRRAVKTGKTTDALVQILEGLEEGEVVYVKD